MRECVLPSAAESAITAIAVGADKQGVQTCKHLFSRLCAKLSLSGPNQHAEFVLLSAAVLAKPQEEEDSPGQGAKASRDFIARLGTVMFQPGTEVRRFLGVPEGATWGEMTLTAGSHDTPRCHTLLQSRLHHPQWGNMSVNSTVIIIVAVEPP